MSRAALCALAVGALAVLSACDGGEAAGDGDAARGSDRPTGTRTVTCSAAILNRVDPEWRSRSVVSGGLGLYANAADVRTADGWGPSAFWTKIPVIVDGHAPAKLAVAAADTERVGLTYGNGPGVSSPATSDDGARGLARAPRSMRFVPCPDRSPTGWAGGLVLADRLLPLRFRVRVGGGPWRSLVLRRAEGR